ncbi:MAG: hypothetical protein JXA52_01205 [Planctomycetes bacterium]|nr:hypothetical protein [Planctomycetota bacterium]
MNRHRLFWFSVLGTLLLAPCGCKGMNPFKKPKKNVLEAAKAPNPPSLTKRVRRLARKGQKGIDSLLGRGPEPTAPMAPVTNIFGEADRDYAYGPTPEYSPQELSRAGNYAKLLLGRQPYENRKATLERLASQPDPEAEPALTIILSTPTDPLSPQALEALSQLSSDTAFRAIRKAVSDPRSSVNAPALLAYIQSGREDAAGLCQQLFTPESTIALRAVAALGLGEMEVIGSADALRKAAITDFSMVRFCAAWALWRMGDDGGRAFIERLAMSNDPTLSPQAISFLYAMGEPTSIPSLLVAMGSSHSSIWIPAFQTLLTMPPESVHEGITLRQPFAERYSVNEIRRNKLLRLALKLADENAPDKFVIGQKERLELHQALVQTSEQDNLPEQLLAVSLLQKWNSPGAIEPLIRMLASPKAELRVASAATLRGIAKQHFPNNYPQGDMQVPWRRWWLRHCTVAAVRDAASGKIVSVIKAPDGNSYFAAQEIEIVPGVVVHKVVTDKNPPAITLFFNKQAYEITGSKPSGLSE